MDAVPQNKQELARRFFAQPLDKSWTAHIKGNTSLAIKELPVKWLIAYRHRGNGFCHNVAEKLEVKEVWIVPKVDDPEKLEGKVVCEVEITPDMCSAEGVLHTGCLMYLIDECSTLAMAVAGATEGRSIPPGVSCSINALFHSTAVAGATLRITNYSLASGIESNSARTEVWDVHNHRLIASGTQLTMPPSVPESWMK